MNFVHRSRASLERYVEYSPPSSSTSLVMRKADRLLVFFDDISHLIFQIYVDMLLQSYLECECFQAF